MATFRGNDEYQREFIKVFNSVNRKYDRWTVWTDFLDSFAAALQLPFYGGKVADRIKNASEKYGDDFLKLDQMTKIVVDALECKFQDFLGTVFMGLELGNKWKGQFFTPYHVCQLMASMNTSDITEKLIAEKGGFIEVADPCVGGGAMIIAACDEFLKNKINFQEKVLFTVQDIDSRCVNMAYIQLALIGAPATVVLGDSLKVECREHWYTPMFFLKDWSSRMRIKSMLDLFRSESVKKEAVIEMPNIEYQKTKTGQLLMNF